MVGYTELFFSKKDQGARTPSGLLKQLKDMFLPPGVRFWDPTPHGWSPRSKWDGLRDPWKAFNFINPPFDQTDKFFQRAIAQEEKCVSFFLVPCRFHTRYFYKSAPHMKHIYLLKEEVNFVGYKVPLPVALCVIVFGKKFHTISSKLTKRPQKHMYLYPMDNGSTMKDLIKQCPTTNFEIGNQVSKPLHDVIVKFAPKKKPFGITMPSRLENKVLFDSIVMNPNVKMVFFNPTMHTNVGKLFNGSLLALFYGAIPRNKALLTTLKIPISVIIDVDTTHSEKELSTVITSALSN
jgi:hypothetical protein